MKISILLKGKIREYYVMNNKMIIDGNINIQNILTYRNILEDAMINLVNRLDFKRRSEEKRRIICCIFRLITFGFHDGIHKYYCDTSNCISLTFKKNYVFSKNRWILEILRKTLKDRFVGLLFDQYSNNPEDTLTIGTLFIDLTQDKRHKVLEGYIKYSGRYAIKNIRCFMWDYVL